MRVLFWIGFIAFAAWCALSDAGRLFTLKMTSAVGLTPSALELDFEKLSGGMKKDAVLAMHPELDYYCYEERKVALFGSHTCNSNIALFNGMRSYNIALFFKGSGLHVVRVALQPGSYDQSVRWLDSRYQRTGIRTENSFTGGKKYPVTVWKTPMGNYVMASQDETAVGETILLWTDSFNGIRP